MGPLIDPPAGPWAPAPVPDATTRLPDPPVPEPVPAGPTVGPVPELSHWPPVVDTVLRYAPIGTASTWGRLSRPVRDWCTVHPEAWKAHQLRDHVGQLRSQGPTAWDEHDAAAADLRALEAEHRWQLRSRKLGAAAGLFLLFLLAVWVLWSLLGAHGMWPLAIGSVWATFWYSAKGWVLSRGLRRPRSPLCDGPGPECATAVPGRPCPTPVPDCPAAVPTRDHGTSPRGLARIVRPRRLDGTEDPTEPIYGGPWDRTEGQAHVPVPAQPVAAPGRPSWLTQETIEKRLTNAFKRLRQSRPAEDGTPLIALVGTEWTGNGWRFQVELPDDAPPASAFVDGREDVAKAWRIPEDRILLTVGAAHPGILEVWVCDHDPLTGTPIWSGLEHIDETNMWDGYVLGGDVMTGEEVRYHPIYHHCLTVGGTGSGKTTLMKLKVAHLVMDPHHLVVFVDPNGGEWTIYADVALHFGGREGVKEALEFVRWLVNVEIERRSKRIAALKREQPMLIGELKLEDFLARDLGEDLYPITVVLEEASRIYTDPDDGDEWYELVKRVESEGRKYGLQVENTFQFATKEYMGPGIAIRELVTTAFCGHVRSKPAAQRALGDDWQSVGNPVRLRPYVHAGVFVVTNGGAVRSSSPRPGLLVRARFTNDAEALVVARKARAVRERVRPQLLPGNWKRPGSAPKRPSGPAATDDRQPEPAAPIDLEPLRRVVEILEPNGTMIATAVIAELGHRWPADHGDLSTVADLNRLLAVYGLRTKQWDVPGGGRPHQLRYSTCATRLKHLTERPDAC